MPLQDEPYEVEVFGAKAPMANGGKLPHPHNLLISLRDTEDAEIDALGVLPNGSTHIESNQEKPFEEEGLG